MKMIFYTPSKLKKKVPKILIISCIIGYLIKVDIRTKLVKITNAVYPNQTPNINGIVFFIPKLKPEKEATALFGPGVNPKDIEIPINKNNSGCI